MSKREMKEGNVIMAQLNKSKPKNGKLACQTCVVEGNLNEEIELQGNKKSCMSMLECDHSWMPSCDLCSYYR